MSVGTNNFADDEWHAERERLKTIHKNCMEIRTFRSLQKDYQKLINFMKSKLSIKLEDLELSKTIVFEREEVLKILNDLHQL